MADFDWANAAKPPAQAFDWSKAAEPPRVTVHDESNPAPAFATEQEKPDTGTGWQDKVRAAIQGATLGFGDEAVAHLVSKFPWLDVPVDDLGAQAPPAKTYEEARAEARDLQEGAAQRNPWSAAAGSLLAPIPGVGAEAGIGRMALHGAAVGGAAALGGSHADLTKGDYAGAAADTAMGAGLGGVMGGALGTLSKSPKGLSDYLKSKAEEKALKAAGAIQSDMSRLGDRAGPLGRDLLDNDVVRFGSGKKAILERAKTMGSEAGRGMGTILDEADTSTGNGFDYGKAISRVRTYLDTLNPTERRAAGNVENMLADLEEAATAPGGERGFRAANEVKSSLQNGINYKADPKLKTGLEKRAAHELMDEIDSQLPAKREEFEGLKRQFGNAAEAQKIAKKAVAREGGNHSFGLSDMMLFGSAAGPGAAAGHSVGGAITGAGLAVANKLKRERGDAMAAVGLDLASKAWTNTVVKLAEVAPDALGKYGKVLAREFAQHGPAGVLAMHHALSNDPQYVTDQKALHGAMGASGE